MSAENPRLNSFPSFNDDLNVISALPNTPLPPDYTASILKAKFDQSANTIQNYINSTLKDTIEIWLEDIVGYAESLDASQVDTAGALSSRISGLEGELATAFSSILQTVKGYVDPIAAGLSEDIEQAAVGFSLGQISDNSITSAKLDRSLRFGTDRYSISVL